jgi:Bacterial SH3 domain
MQLSLASKLLLGFGALAAFLYVTGGTANAAVTGGGSGGGGGGTGGNVTTPNAGDKLLVVTAQTGAAGQLNIRTAAGTQNQIVGTAQHGDTLTATGAVQTAPDGSIWWGVKTAAGLTGWSESNYLQDMGIA